MSYSGMLRRVDHVRTNVSEELSAFFIKVTRIGELGITLAVTGNRRTLRRIVTANIVPSSPILVTLMKEALRSSETSIITRVTRRNIPENAILHSHRRENLKSYIALTGWTVQRKCNVSPVKYELGFYISVDDILHSHRRDSLKSYIVLLHTSSCCRAELVKQTGTSCYLSALKMEVASVQCMSCFTRFLYTR
jgi:hypothetical protein